MVSPIEGVLIYPLGFPLKDDYLQNKEILGTRSSVPESDLGNQLQEAGLRSM